MGLTSTIISGKKAIVAFVGRSWPVIRLWIEKEGFPACKIYDRWESDAELILKWRKAKISGGQSTF